MKKPSWPVVALAFFVIYLPSAICSVSIGNISVPIQNLRNLNKGDLYVFLLKKMDRVDFSRENALQIKKIPVKSSNLEVVFENIPYGEYAITIFHDMNQDQKMSSNFLGIPREDLGCSNNAKGGPLGGPKWAEARFILQTKLLKITPIVMAHLYK